MTALYAHALRLHREHPDTPLPNDGEPYPCAETPYPHRWTEPDERRKGTRAAALLDAHFGRPSATPAELAANCAYVDVPIHPNEHITAAALRADAGQVRATGRWLVRHGTDTSAVAMGMALLATDRADEDIPLIQTIGLLSCAFGPLAAHALIRRMRGGDALLWLAQRVTGWGRVYVIQALCRMAGTRHRHWLLRNACDGHLLNGYFAGDVATAAHLHEAITRPDPDAALIDHTSWLLIMMSDAEGMGMPLDRYPPADLVLAAHADALSKLPPTLARRQTAAMLAEATEGRWPDAFRRYQALPR